MQSFCYVLKYGPNLAQQWLVCTPLGIHFEPINKAVSDNIIIINCATGPMRELCSAKYEAICANGAPYELIKNTACMYMYIYKMYNLIFARCFSSIAHHSTILYRKSTKFGIQEKLLLRF